MDITLLVKIVLMLFAAIYTYVLIPWIKAKTNEEQFSNLKYFTAIGVQAAEMIYTDPGMGQKKKEYVLNFLKEKGYSVDVTEIDAMIESAVLELKERLAK